MGSAVCRESYSRNIHFEEIVRRSRPSFSDTEDFDLPVQRNRAQSEGSFLSRNSRKMPKMRLQRVLSNPELDERKNISLKQRMQMERDRRKNSKQRCRGKVVVSALRRRRNTTLSKVTKILENTTETGDSIIDELASQRETITKTKDILPKAEEDLHEIRGIMSMSGKLATVITSPLNGGRHYKDAKIERPEQSKSAPLIFPSLVDRRGENSACFQVGLNTVGNLLDKLHEQQTDVRDELNDQGQELDEVRVDMDRIHSKLVRQSRVVDKKIQIVGAN